MDLPSCSCSPRLALGGQRTYFDHRGLAGAPPGPCVRSSAPGVRRRVSRGRGTPGGLAGTVAQAPGVRRAGFFRRSCVQPGAESLLWLRTCRGAMPLQLPGRRPASSSRAGLQPVALMVVSGAALFLASLSLLLAASTWGRNLCLSRALEEGLARPQPQVSAPSPMATGSCVLTLTRRRCRR
ncbi:hypothetical protein NDU88_000524 [Pleurodeles waltl]|uniref:Uncharacterized protein n=1 Tax=Pleurodeles waltl TaxID=8319 RepID=A0AAV7KQ60_PLEWA|nr:hypothetical protein NDU88_000524 [Pleurodeles waltl]